MQRVVVQVPMAKNLKEKAEAVSFGMGFSSLQEVIRAYLPGKVISTNGGFGLL